MHNKSTQRKLASHKKISHGEISRRTLATVAKKNKLEAKKIFLLSEKGLQLLAVNTPPVINHLS